MSSIRVFRHTLLPATLLALAATAGAQDLSSLKQLGSQGLSSLGGSSTSSMLGKIATPANRSNAAGLLEYCVKNKYLGAESGATSLKNKLLGNLGGKSQASTQDSNYQQGLKGIVNGSGGQHFDLGQQSGQLKQKLADKVCQTVLKKGSSLL